MGMKDYPYTVENISISTAALNTISYQNSNCNTTLRDENIKLYMGMLRCPSVNSSESPTTFENFPLIQVIIPVNQCFLPSSNR